MEIKVAYQGVPGAYSEKATRQLLGNHAQVVALGFPSFDAAFRAVDSGDADFGVLPIENSLGGSIHANYDLLLRVGLRIVGEYDLRVEHSLLALPGVRKRDIKTVISHPQALAQCAHSIEAMGATARAEYDTAGSAKMLADNQWKDTAAVASDLAAEYYGLEVLERNVEDDAGNFTRFLLLAKHDDAGTAAGRPHDAAADAEFKTSVVFSFMDSNEKGQLYKALSAFSLRDIDLAKIESRPWGYSAAQQILGHDHTGTDASPDFSVAPPLEDRRKYKYLFYIDIIGHQTDENVVNALRHLREFCKFVRVLGSYPTKGRLIGDVRKKLEAVGAYPPASPALTSSAPTVSPRLNVGIYGFGNFGQFLTKTITKYHNVRATSRTDYAQVAQSLGAKYYSSETDLEAFFKDLDVLVLCVSILSFEKVLQKIPKALLEKLVVIDVLSVKTHPKQILLRELPASTSILCTHPMFGPESGKYSWRGLNMMYEKVRVVESDHALAMAQFLRVFESELCRMLEMTCEAHDEFAASSQFLTHLTGRILSVQGVKNTPIDTRGFKNLVRLVEDTCKDSFDLFQGLYEFNPNSESQIQKFEDSLREVTQKLKLTTGAPSNSNVVAKQPETMAEKYPLNPLLGKVSAAKTVVIHGITKQLEAEGKNVYSLCVGEPDFLPDPRVLEAGKQGFASGNVKYTDVKGTIELRKSIADYLDRCKGVQYNPQTEILVSNGAKQSVFQSLLAVCKPGEKVLIPSPYWVSYPAMVKLVNAEPVVLRTTIEEQYLINPEALERTLTAHPEIKVMIFCNPSNPSGTLHSPEHLERIAAVLRKPAFRHVLVIADEIYEQLVYQEPGVAKREHQTFASLPGMYERTLLINGFSKSHAMPGLRVGYLAAPKYFVDVCTKLQGQFTSCASSIGQHVATAAMQLEMECVDRGEHRIIGSLEGLDKKRQYVLQRLQQIPKLRYAHPTSAFYVFLDLAQYFEAHKVSTDEGKPLASTDDFCEYLLLKFHVALVPGSAFGEVHGLRISYASSMDTIENAMNGLQNALASLKLVACPSASVPASPVVEAAPIRMNGTTSTIKSMTNGTAQPETMAEKYPLNPLLGKVSAAKTVVIHGITKQLEAEGKNVYSLCVGEPDFLPDPRVLEAGKQGFASGNVKYTDVKGTIELRKSIADYLDRCKGVQYNPQTEILVSNGAKQSVFQSLLAVCKPGEKVLIPSPYWVSYPAMVKLVNAEPVVLRTTIEEQYLINPEALERTLTAHPEIKVMIFCNPSNPSGTLHSPEHLERIAAVLRKPAFRHVLVIADEIYEQLVYQEPGVAKREHQTFASLPGMYERTLLINGFSKSHAMPGLRVGYLAAPKYFVDVCTKLQGQFTSCASSIGQHVATAAMQLEMECVDRGEHRIIGSLEGLDKKRQYVLQRLQQIPKLRYAHPTSAFYVFLDLAQYFEAHKVSTDEGKPLASTDDFCEYLLLKFHVALVPGSAFGEVHGLRISYASSMDTIENAMNGLQNALASLKLE